MVAVRPGPQRTTGRGQYAPGERPARAPPPVRRVHHQLDPDPAGGVGGVQVGVPGQRPVLGPGGEVHGRGVGVAQSQQHVLVERVGAVGVTRRRGERQDVGDLLGGQPVGAGHTVGDGLGTAHRFT